MTRKFLTVAMILAVTTLYRPATAQDDPSNFVAMLNAARAKKGLSPVAHDSNLATWASRNTAQQAMHGLGHFVSCGTGQCSAMAWDAGSALAQWAASPAHAAILFDPNATTCGFSAGGGWATANVSSAGAAIVQQPVYAMPALQPTGWIYPAAGQTWAACPAPNAWWRSGGRWRRWR